MLRVEWIRSDGTYAHRWLNPAEPSLTIGRTRTSHVPLKGFATVSASHATLSYRGGRWRIVDHGRTPTILIRGGESIPLDRSIRPGDVLHVGGEAGARLLIVDKPPPASLDADGIDPDVTLGARPEPPTTSTPVLTDLQVEILRAFAADPDRTIRDVAELLVRDREAIDRTLGRIYRRLGIPSQRGGMIPLAVARARELDLL